MSRRELLRNIVHTLIAFALMGAIVALKYSEVQTIWGQS